MLNPLSFSAMRDELTKISEVSLSGISPQKVLEAPQRLPMETAGFDKARQILTRAEMQKTAARKPNREDYSKTRRYVAPTAAGAATGALLGSLTSLEKANQKHRVIGAGIGASAALFDALMRHHKKELPHHG